MGKSKISNFTEGYAQYNQTAVNGSLDAYLKIFVKEHANLISTANKSIKKRMRELGLIDKQDRVISNNKTPKVSKPVVKENSEFKKDKESEKDKQDNAKSVPVNLKPDGRINKTPDFELDQKVLDQFAKAHKGKKNRTGLSVIKKVPSGLLDIMRYNLGPDCAGLTNQETIVMYGLVYLTDLHNLDTETQQLIQDSDPALWEYAKKYRAIKKAEEGAETKALKRELDEVFHLNKQLVLLLSYYISLSRWGFDNDTVNDVKDIGKLDFDTPSVAELIKATRNVSDKMLRDERNRKGSNMA